MFRHISMYTLKEHPGNGKTREENLTQLKHLLEQVPVLEPTVKHSMVGTGAGAPPELPEGAPQFFHLVQIIDFETMEDCLRYPACDAHAALSAFGTDTVESVACIDFEY